MSPFASRPGAVLGARALAAHHTTARSTQAAAPATPDRTFLGDSMGWE
ncbi:hypothetical protein [Kitasatospora sp. NPDC085879]|jgi:hypothetical protein